MKTSLIDNNSTRAANFSFSALLFVLSGWTKLEILLLSRHAGYGAQLSSSVVGISLSIIACRRYRSWWMPMCRSMRATTLHQSSRAGWVAGGIVMAMAGFMLAYAMRTGLLGGAVGAGLLACVPWCRIALCRRSFFLSQVLLLAGGLPVVMTDAGQRHPVFLLADSWILWALAAGLLLATLRTKGAAMPPQAQVQAESKGLEDDVRR